MIRFVIPAYNEAENIPRLLADLAPRARALGARVIFVDDGSTRRHVARSMRRTATTCTSPSCGTRVNRGLGTAINSGLRAALGEASDDDAIVTLEADSTSDLDDLPAHARALRRRATTSCSPRSTRRAARSSASTAGACAATKAVSSTFRVLGGLREIHTLSSLYRVYRAGTLRRAAETYGYLLVREPGFAANVELLLKLYNAGRRDRRGADDQRLEHERGGVSKMQLQPDGARVRPPDGRPPRRPHPAAADLAARRRHARSHAGAGGPAAAAGLRPRLRRARTEA